MRWVSDDAAAESTETTKSTLLQRIRAEFREMPGLKLTAAQATRLWQLDPRRSEEFLNTLVGDGLLRRNADGAYLISTDTVRSRRG
jgi:hypothetical protein